MQVTRGGLIRPLSGSQALIIKNSFDGNYSVDVYESECGQGYVVRFHTGEFRRNEEGYQYEVVRSYHAGCLIGIKNTW